MVLAVVVASVLVRAIYWTQLGDGPCVQQHRWDQTDMSFFDRWAREIADGDWLTDQSLHPMHGWHRQFAEAHFRASPGARAMFERAAASRAEPADPARALWDHWFGEKRFHQEPLYAYLIAATYRALAPDVRWVFAWQLLLGVLSNVLIYALARRSFGERVGVIAAALAVLSGPLLMYELTLLRTTLLVSAGLALTYLSGLALERPTPLRWLLLGVAYGASLLLRTTFGVLWIGLVAFLGHRFRREPRAFGRAALLLLLGLGVGVAPALVRNVAVGAPAWSLSSVTPVVFLANNSADHDPVVGAHLSTRHGPGIMGRSDGALWPVVAETLRTHESVGSYVGLAWARFAVLWHWYERPNNTNFYYYRLHSTVLRHLPVTFWILAPLGILGLALALPRRDRCGLLYVLVLSNLAPLLVLTALSRYRAPLFASLIPFAALTIERIARWLVSGRIASAATALLLCGAVSIWSMRPLPPEVPRIRRADYAAGFQVHYDRLLREALERGDRDRAPEIVAEALELEPETLRRIALGVPVAGRVDRGVVALFAAFHSLRADLLRAAGRDQLALVERQKAHRLADWLGEQRPEPSRE